MSPSNKEASGEDAPVSDDELHHVEKEVTKLLQDAGALSNELLDIQEEININRLREIENTGKRLHTQPSEDIIPPTDIIDNLDDNQNYAVDDESE
jgi:hypothetical protein